MTFELNRGQADPQVRFLSRARGYQLFLTQNGLVVHFPSPPHREPTGPRSFDHRLARAPADADTVIQMRLAGANRVIQTQGLDEVQAKTSYFPSSDRSTWHTQIPNYERVRYKGVYSGTDLLFYGQNGRLEYDFVLGPGANYRSIRLDFGKSKVALDGEGRLSIGKGRERIEFDLPKVYQQAKRGRKEIAAQYQLLADHNVSFRIGPYDHRRPLVIDPTLVYSTYLGGVGDYVQAIGLALDSAKNAYVLGATASPTTFPGPGPLRQNGNCFVSKFNATGSALVYTAILNAGCSGLAVDPVGNVWVIGWEPSSQIPWLVAYVAKIDPTGSSLLFTNTYATDARGKAVAVDSNGYAYIVGSVDSNDFPVTASGFQQSCENCSTDVFGEASNGFFAKLDPSGNILYATYYAGPNNLTAYMVGVAIGPGGNAYVVGDDLQGFNFITEFDPNSSGAASLVFSTGFPNSSATINALASDAAGNAYITGTTGDVSFPTTVGSFQPTYPCCGSGFMTKYSPSGSIKYSTFLGGGNNWAGNQIAVDGSGIVYVAGSGNNSTDAIPATAGMSSDGFLAQLNPASGGASDLVSMYMTIGSSALAVDGSGDAFLTASPSAISPTLWTAPLILPAFRGTESCPPDISLQLCEFTYSDAVVFEVAAHSAPALGINPGLLQFPSQTVGSTSPAQTIVITSAGDQYVDLNNIEVSGDFAQVSSCGAVPVSIPPQTGGNPKVTCTLTVTFTPTTTGTRTGSITFTDNAPGSPQVASLSGKGLASTISLVPSSLNFPTQAPGSTSAAQGVRLTVGGTVAAQISGIATQGNFQETNNCLTNMTVGSSCTISVTFSPQSSGALTGSLIITDSARASPQTVALSGIGSGAAIGLGTAPGSSSSGTVAAGTTANYVLQIGGQGFAGIVSLSCTGAPKGALCSIPASEGVSGTTAATFPVTVSTTSRTAIVVGYRPLPILWSWDAVLLGAIVLAVSRRPSSGKAGLGLPTVVLLFLLCACGGGSPSNGGPTPNPSGTPAGTYPLTVTAVPSSGMAQSTQLTLIVQ